MSTALPKPQVPGSRSGSSLNKQTHKTPPHKTTSHQKTQSHTHHREIPHYNKGKKGGSSRTGVLRVLIIVTIGVLSWANKDSILQQLQERGLRGNSTNNSDMSKTLFVGQDINLSGTIAENSNKLYYTHTLQTDNNGMLGLRSSTIPLDQYKDAIQIMGKVVDYQANMYIIEVVNVASLTPTNTGTIVSGKQYIASAGIIISDLDSDNLTRDQGDTSTSINQGLFSISDITNNNKVMVRYIACDKSNPARNCEGFVQSFDNAQRADFVDSYGNTFYKLADAKTWFASIDNMIGIYLESEDPTMIPRVMRHLQFVNNVWAKKTFITTAKDICVNTDIAINMPMSFTVVRYEDTFAVNVEGTAINGGALSCMIAIDPSNSLGGTLININVANEITNESGTVSDDNADETDITSDPVINTNGGGMTPPAATVKQFPLKPGKELTFNSRGKKIIFPSSNISFSSFNVNEKIAGLSCSMGTKVIVYADKANLESNPSIILYSCKTGTPSLSETMVSFDAAGMTYIVDVKDPSWYDFATHIIIEATTSN